MPRIDLAVALHKLNVDLDMKPIKQKKRYFNAKRYQAIREEVEKLFEADFSKEVNYLDWMANVVLVKK